LLFRLEHNLVVRALSNHPASQALEVLAVPGH
jgi:hypothetical protein